MATISWEQVVAVRVGEELVCKECVTNEERDAAELGDLMTEQERDRDDDKAFFCDRCKARI